MTTEGNTAQFATNPLSLLNPAGSIGGISLNSGQNSVLPSSTGALHILSGAQYSISNTSPPTNAQKPSSPPNILKLSNLPPDITLREAHLIFSLVADDIISIDLSDYIISVYFKTLATCITTGKLLDGKFIFGLKCPPAKVEFDSNTSLAYANSAFENLRLSNSTISPPTSHQLSAPQPPTLLHLQPGSSSGAAGYDTFQKRASVGSQRLRFLFSDPFLSTTNSNTSGPLGTVSDVPGSIVLGDLTNKSLLMMSQTEPRDFETLQRDPWGTLNLAFTSNPQTPGLTNVPNAFDWGNSTGTAPSNANNTQTQQATLGASSMNSSPPNISQVPLNERRRTSAFFNGGQSTVPLTSTSSQTHLASHPVGAPGLSQMSGSQKLVGNVGSVGTIGAAGSSSSVSAAGLLGHTTSRNGTGAVPSSNTGNNQSVDPILSVTATPSTQPQRQLLKDVPDLSLLAKVPPPANPADQNPPCNTLYVGNLPPDATEAELRALFSPQKGFRRLSFRTKNQTSNSNGSSSGHNHGPMCFVEFDDVLLATEALADLYGSALPRSNGSSSKGGIRLSFSKNPLGVRGPGNPRRSSTNQLSTPNGTSNNGVGNYGYLNYR